MPEGTFTPVRACRICGHDDLARVIDLGEQPLANAFVPPSDDTHLPTFPLALLFCPSCGLLSLSGVVDAELMFSDYRYATGVSASLRRHFAAYAEGLARAFLNEGGLLVEIGSNDGTLLRALPSHVRGLGVDPASNLVEAATADGLDMINAFFTPSVAADIARDRGRATVVVGNNVMAHIDDLSAIGHALDVLLDDDGVFVLEAPGSLELSRSLAFDTLYHEHLSVLGLHPLRVWAARHGLTVFDVEEQPVHGGSIRVFFDRGRRARSQRVDARMARERDAGITTAEGWASFADRVTALLDTVKAEVDQTRAAGGLVAAYGASAKSTVLLNAAGLTRDDIVALYDKSPLKQGRLAPGSGIPIAPAEQLLADQPALCLLCVWNLVDEIAEEQAAYLARGGELLVPIPSVRRLGKAADA
jgi:hypothetical protein